MSVFNKSKTQDIFLGIVSLLGFVLVLIVTSRYGPGVSGDAAHFLGGAKNISEGNGFRSYTGGAIILWAPLYPALLGLLSNIFSASPLILGGYLNAVTFGAIILSGGILFRRVFPQNPIWLYLGTLTILLSITFLSLSTNISSDPLFILLSILFILIAQDYLVKPELKKLVLMAILTSLATYIRYSGAVLIAIGGILIFFGLKNSLRKMISHGVIFGLLSAVPIFIWVYFRNYLIYGSLTGVRNYSRILIWENIQFTWTRMLHWFLPYSVLDNTWIMMLFGLVVLAIVLRGNKRFWKKFVARIQSPIFAPIFWMGLINFIFVVLTTFTPDHFGPFDDRYQSVILVPLVVYIFLFIQDTTSDNNRKFNQLFIIIPFFLWLVYPAFSVYKYSSQSLNSGVIAHNIFTQSFIQESEFIDFVQTYPFDEDLVIFSNNLPLTFIYLDKALANSIPSLDRLGIEGPINPNKEITGWFDQLPAYLVWIDKPVYNQYYTQPETLQEHLNLELIFQAPEGRFYLISP